MASIDFLEHFKELEDFRQQSKVCYPLSEILLLVLCGVISDVEGWQDIVLYGQVKLDFLRQFLPFKNGIPSEDTLERVFAHLNPKSFQGCFLAWVQSLQTELRETIAIDGKTLRRTFDSQHKAIHMVSAFASHQGLVLGQEKTHEKSNEITAIPKLLELLVLKGAIVTIDAMGCQREIAQQIVDQKADYVLALKGNQGSLHEDVVEFLQDQKEKGFKDVPVDLHETIEKDHGRLEIRKYYSASDVGWLKERHDWPYLRSIAMVESYRIEAGKTSVEQRFFISSLEMNAQEVAGAIRAHWGIENRVHWVLDVVFKEDDSRIRKGHSPQNFAVVKHMALNLIRKVQDKRSLRRRRKLAGWDNTFLIKILKIA